MRAHWWEVIRLCSVAGSRPHWQRLAAFVVSVWTLWWIVGQFLAPDSSPSAVEVWRGLLERVGVFDTAWSDRVVSTWESAGALLAVFGGLLWAATTERGQVPALLGWIAVMLGSQRLGYQPSVVIAVTTMVGFVLVLWVVSLANSRFVDRYPRLLPGDVFRAGVTAATLSAVVPLYAPAAVVFRLFHPYLTRTPRILPTEYENGQTPAVGGWSRVSR
ncbi:hypothetical protein SAMN04487905_106226 [Actinopolyspora xinjiangensis]|uniref:Uncharacterized protein n=1 Tax=Actinopolyspora xinjiangensis TaxID=405564 RepID=A0A1H0UE04_9ACTN|nr:hypothetical protein [Actinopolyspora xinjiangensis]SDP64404.1 hypothetical protein SAMN04487905_106226 [Actinopolyspora xinjiangensis]